jgi:SagB-type dehydrogenase family enzyme
MRIRTPKTLVAFPKDDGIVLYNYLTKDAITCALDDLYWITLPSQWTDISEILCRHADIDPDSLCAEYTKLTEAGMLIVENSTNHGLEREYEKTWEMGIATGMFHFTLLDNEVGTQEDSVRQQKLRMANDPSPPLFWKNSPCALALPRQFSSPTQELMGILQKRRTVRNVTGQSLKLEDLSACLFAGLGLIGFVQTSVQWLPLKLTPSGGARNPYEAFVMVQNIEGLDSGMYHYSAYDHSLERIADLPGNTAGQLLKGQDWANDMGAVIFLVAVLERTMWKYNDPNSYRVVIMEAGHIAQNMMLACAANGLTACPTGAMSHSLISSALKLTALTHTPVYALSLGYPGQDDDPFMTLAENELLKIVN